MGSEMCIRDSVIYGLGRLAYTRPEKHKLVTGTIVFVALVALVLTLIHA